MDGRVVCLLPAIDSDEMLYLVLKRWSQLPDILKSNAVFGYGNPCWPTILEAERGKQIEHGDVDVPAHDESWCFWKGRTIEEVLALYRAERDPAPVAYMKYRGQLIRLPGSRVCRTADPSRLFTLREAHFLRMQGIPLPADCTVPEDWAPSKATRGFRGSFLSAPYMDEAVMSENEDGHS